MAKFRPIPQEYLQTYDADDIIAYILDGKSPLNTLGVGELRHRYDNIVHQIRMLEVVLKVNSSSAAKNRIHSQNALKTLFPSRIVNIEERDLVNKAIVIGFNHPSHGEIIRIVEFCFENFPNRAILMPVSLPIYEAVAEYIPLFFSGFGIQLAPLLTNENFEYIVKRNPNNAEIAKNIRNALAQHFYDFCIRYGSAKNIIFLPISTDCRDNVFPSYITDQGQKFEPRIVPVLNALTLSSCVDASFMPLSIATPKRKSKTDLNPFKTYCIVINNAYSSSELRSMMHSYGPDVVEYQFHQRIKLALDNKLYEHL